MNLPGARWALTAAVLLSVAACGDGPPPSRSDEPGASPPERDARAEDPQAGEQVPDPLPRAPLRADSYPADWLLLDSWSPDGEVRRSSGEPPAETASGPGDAPESSFPAVELRVDAARDGAGRIMWDDGHRWLLVVREGPLSARLVDEFVPNGVVRFWVVDDQEGELIVVTEMDSGTAGVRTTAWVRDADGEAWTATARVAATGNTLHRTRPDLLR